MTESAPRDRHWHRLIFPLGGWLFVLCGRTCWLPCLLAGLAWGPPALGQAGTPAEAKASHEKAVQEILAAGGGVLVIPPTAAKQWLPQSPLQEEWRKPPPPAPAKSWGVGPGVTVIDLRSGSTPDVPEKAGPWPARHGEQPRQTHSILPPQVSGLRVSGTLKVPQGHGLPHGSGHRMIGIENTIARGSMISPDGLQQIDAGIQKGAALHNKTHANILKLDTHSHNENQTFDLMLWQHHYSQGDTSLVNTTLSYMGDVRSPAGDNNGVLLGGFVEGLSHIFRATIDAYDATATELTFKDAKNDHTLGSGRPIINLNPTKWMCQGTAFIMHPGGSKLGWGGSIRSCDAAWTQDMVGRYFAVDEPDEYVPGGDAVRRWYLITSVAQQNGTTALGVQRHWWGAKNHKSVGSLYNSAHYTINEKNPKPLRYIIAPGVHTVDVSDGLPSGDERRLLRLAPPPFAGTSVDFAAGDPIEQAIGPDPFQPIPFRSWMWDLVPGVFPSAVFDIANQSQISRHAVFLVAGGSGDLQQDRTSRSDKSAVWGRMIGLQATSRDGLVFAADVGRAAILFEQPRVAAGQPQTMKWNAAVPRSMGVGPSGEWRLAGQAPLAVADTPVSGIAGISGEATPAANLRGIGLAVPAGDTSIDLALPNAEASDTYAVIVRLSWIASHAVTHTTAQEFTVEWDRPAPAGARLDWILVR